jgi:hypothetical protein
MSVKALVRILQGTGIVLCLAASPASGEYVGMPGAVLQGLDKITARVSELPIQNGQTVQFGSLVIRVSACNRRPPEEPPEATAFVEIGDGKQTPPKLLFRGWMFASSPAVSAFEHPVYDVRVLRCLVR